jgi:hypothetical protein
MPEGTVQIGRNEHWLTLKLDPWTFHLKLLEEGRYPKVDEVVPAEDKITARCRFHPADAAFVLDGLSRLPGEEEQYKPVTVDLNGSVCLRAKSEKQPQATELVLTNSSYQGEAMRLNTNRLYLTRALRLGFTEMQIVNPDQAYSCRDEKRTYVWMPLSAESALKPDKKAVSIASPKADSVTTPVEAAEASPSQLERKKTTVTDENTTPVGECTGKSNGHAASSAATKSRRSAISGRQAGSNGHTRKGTRSAVGPRDMTALIAEAEAVSTTLRNATLKSNELVKSLKRHRHENRIVANTLASLRQLKSIGV